MSDSDNLDSASRGTKITIAAGLLVIALAIFWWGSGGASGVGGSSSDPALAFYSVDDGATWFKDSADRVPPFQHEGKTADQVVLFTADGGKTKFAGYLQRFSTEVKKQLDAGVKVPRTITGLEVKKPGAKGVWVARNSKAGMDVVNVKSPSGSGEVEEVSP